MKAEPFVRARAEEWRRYEELVEVLSSKRRRKREPAVAKHAGEFPALYRRLCRDLALARHRDFDPLLIDRLNRLALDGHRLLHRDRTTLVGSVGRFFAADFPRAVRREAAFVGWGHLAFWGPFFGMLLVGHHYPEVLASFLGRESLAQVEEMYDPSNDVLGVPPDETRFFMFGFYILNNVGIAFRTFGAGILFGVGSVFVLVYNGLAIGGVLAHLWNVGFLGEFLPFGVGHGSVELTAICLSGAAGMKMGGALIRPGRRSRRRALVEEGREAVTLLYGAAAFLFGAAVIEAFWSPSPLPVAVKYTVGGLGWLAVLLYFLFAGREAAEGGTAR